MSDRSQPENDVFTSIKQVNRAAEIKTQLMRAIESGHFRPGDRLPSERELGEMFGVSRVSVREALRALEAVHMVEVFQGRGSFVAQGPSAEYPSEFLQWLKLHKAEVLDLFKVRGALDSLAASEAATNAGKRELTRIKNAAERFEALATADPPRVDELADCDREFHSTIAVASGSQLLARLLADLNDRLVESRTLAFQVPARLARSVQGHREIVDAILARKPADAHAATMRHIAHGEEALAAALARSADSNGNEDGASPARG
ncbi:MAG TPA: FadR/GntR family transcriptional regulator [Gaiellaceae bacterium]|nr:FadR/GntR family transcriptional regulator [Gaiellaceae bacterium]